MLRHAADRRTIAYLAFTVSLAVVNWNLPASVPPLLRWSLYALALWMSVTVAIISHNHNHVAMWKNKNLNLFTNYVIALFYGHPAVAWIPTHNKNHHTMNNRPGDRSRGPKVFKNSHLLALIIYPTLTGIEQMADVKIYFRQLWARDRNQFFRAFSEYAVFGLAMVLLFLLDWKKALLFFLIPQQFALWVIQVFNYVQHVEANENSEWNHSRNFVSPVLNALLFNNGYHTVHHHKPGVHWSQTPALHAEHAHKIDPSLQVPGWWEYMIGTFILRPFMPSQPLPKLQ